MARLHQLAGPLGCVYFSSRFEGQGAAGPIIHSRRLHNEYISNIHCLGNGGPYDMEGFQKCLHPLKVLAKAYV